MSAVAIRNSLVTDEPGSSLAILVNVKSKFER
jgi:hypothetical protein